MASEDMKLDRALCGLLIASVLAGCISTPPWEKKAPELVGVEIAEVLRENGPPALVMPDDNGGQILVWERAWPSASSYHEAATLGEPYNNPFKGELEPPLLWKERLFLHVGSDGRVSDARYEYSYQESVTYRPVGPHDVVRHLNSSPR